MPSGPDSSGAAPDVQSTWRPGRPVDLPATLSVLVRGSADPSHRLTADGQLWRASRTPQGPVTLHLRVSHGDVEASAWGPGAAWAVDGVPDLLGARDDPTGFEPQHPTVQLALVRRPGWRVPRTALVLEALVPAVIEQKVTGQEAFSAWRRLLRRFGELAPGPAGAAGMRVPPSAAQWTAIPSWEWLQAGVDGARSATVVRAARAAGRLEQTLDLPGAEAEKRIRSLPGVGVWTAAEVRHRAHGDADAVSFGDFHVPGQIGLALVGERVDDAGLAELLEPYRPHRYRVQRLVQLEGPRQSRRAPRPTPRFHVPVRR
ncbi:DNA-3-methyladenine glycosylase family protein [Angustibacter sp. McL0619]|uniref:DNA-3-methyladenine glycosylase family protein n=1 Tax=Angustibacter sp. McL0619 TaxID=3415676 RepID=UPI003CF36C53